MQPTRIALRAAKPFSLGFAAAVVLGALATGCVNYCISGVINPPGAAFNVQSGNPPPVCTLNPATGTVTVSFVPAKVLHSASRPPAVRHLFVSIRGIDVHPGVIADPDSPDWKELAPGLAKLPAQVDLLSADAAGSEVRRLAAGIVPAGTYRQVRLRLLPNHPAEGVLVPEANRCGSAGFNCAVSAEGEIQPLAFDQLPELRIGAENIDGGFFRILPDARVDLELEFKPDGSFLVGSGDSLRLVAAFRVTPRSPGAGSGNASVPGGESARSFPN